MLSGLQGMCLHYEIFATRLNVVLIVKVSIQQRMFVSCILKSCIIVTPANIINQKLIFWDGQKCQSNIL